MELFLDTNVLFGYTFKTDRWNSQSLCVIKSKFDKYSSINVKNEYERKYRDSSRFAKTEIDQMICELSRKSSVNPKKLIAVLNKHFLKPAVTSLLEAGLSTRDSESLRNDLREIERTCRFEFLENRKTLEKCIIFIDRGREGYEKVYSKLCEINLVSSNRSDSYIVLDAHHVGLTKSNNLHFVTSDWEDILKRKDAIISCTSIKDIIRLAEFSEYCKRNGS
jgi:hypothetical protein